MDTKWLMVVLTTVVMVVTILTTAAAEEYIHYIKYDVKTQKVLGVLIGTEKGEIKEWEGNMKIDLETSPINY